MKREKAIRNYSLSSNIQYSNLQSICVCGDLLNLMWFVHECHACITKSICVTILQNNFIIIFLIQPCCSRRKERKRIYKSVLMNYVKNQNDNTKLNKK